MAVVAGIDEAGYGPFLGPLVVSGVAFELPDEAAGEDLWVRLADVVTRSPRDGARVPVDDSKRLFNQTRGVRHIERAALAFAAAAGHQVTTFRGLLAALADLREDVDTYPWHAGAEFAIPLANSGLHLEADASRLRGASGARFLGAKLLPVLVGEFNRLVAAHDTKSATLFLKTARLLSWLWNTWGERDLLVYVDKHGGRNRYGHLLHEALFGATVRTIAEGASKSVYTVTDDARRMTIGFYEKGDGRHLSIALASIYSKYLRELFMHLFNAWWCERVPGLKPTAGYFTDGQRFLADTAVARQQLGIPDAQLIRIA